MSLFSLKQPSTLIKIDKIINIEVMYWVFPLINYL